MAILKEDLIQTEPCRYGLMSFFRNDNTVSRSLREYGEWAQAEINLLGCLIDPGDTVLDIGAFVGTHTLAFARKVGDSGTVYAFEPQPVFFEVLKKNISQNGLTNVRLYDVAVSDKRGLMELVARDASEPGNFGGTGILEIDRNCGDTSALKSIELLPIDQLGIKSCALIKVDTHNMEIDVLKGALQTLRATCPVVYAECNSLEYGWPIVEFAGEERYRSYLFNVRSYNPDNFRHNPDNFLGECQEAGLVLIPANRLDVLLGRLETCGTVAQLVPISCIDDLALALLKKPQYKYEVLAKTKAASALGVEFWANEVEVENFHNKIADLNGEGARLSTELLEIQRIQAQTASALARKAEELDEVIAEREIVTRQSRALTVKHAETLSTLAGLREEHAKALNALAGLREEHGKTLSTLAGLREEHAESISALGKMQAEFKQATEKVQEKALLLAQIQSSHGWRALSLYYRLRNRLIPERIQRAVREGVRLLRDARLVSASGLLDREWYLRQNPDVAAAHVNPLRHYLRRGAFEGRDPNPWFDSNWYLQQYQDVAKAGVNPLVHYLRYGAIEGRDPSPRFDSDWYLQQYQDVAKVGVNPLVHYVLFGTREGRSPRPGFDGNSYVPQSTGEVDADGVRQGDTPVVSRPPLDYAQASFIKHALERPAFRLRPIACPAQPAPLKRSAVGQRLICITHVLPYPPRAGNEYRIHRMLDWFAANGFDVFLAVCPLPGCVITPQQLASACSIYSNLILCERDGTLSYHLADGDGPVKGLDRVRPRYFGKLLGEEDDTPPISRRLLPFVRNFCPDLLAEVLSHLDSVLQPEIILAEYVFMTRALPLVRTEAIKVVDTHDVFSTKHDKIVQFGIEDSLALSADEEASLLAPADLVIAIQSEEAAELGKLVPNKPIVTVGIDFDPIATAGASVPDPIVLVVGSDNALNVRGLRDFLRFAWPLVRRDVPDAELHVVGAVGLQVEVDDPSVKIMGLVDDLTAAYAEARVVINPAFAGTGLKIKTIESLCHLRPLVTWSSGVDGVEADIRSLCYIATDWYMFAQHVIQLCKSEDASQVLVRKREEILRRFSPDTTYAALKAALNGVHVGAS
ncbi:MAG: FkbM family methyltransferase [Candidatus Korobacteraceae bacterium]